MGVYWRRFWLLLGVLQGMNAHAGLLAEATRVIYPAEASQGKTVKLANTNPWPVLVQTWVDTGEGDPGDAGRAPLVVLPAVFRLEPLATQSLRIVHTGESLPKGHESLFWLNLHEVPPSDPDAGGMQLRLTFNTQLKVLYRPAGVGTPQTLAAQLQFDLEQRAGQWIVHANNPTPWHATLLALDVDGVDGALSADHVDVVPPFTGVEYPLSAGQPAPGASIHFELIGDAGESTRHHAQASLIQ